MDVSIIIVNYKTVSLILKCLNSIQRLTRKISYEIIVVDNNSNDDFATYIQQQYPKVNAARKSKVDDNTARMQSIKQLGV